MSLSQQQPSLPTGCTTTTCTSTTSRETPLEPTTWWLTLAGLRYGVRGGADVHMNYPTHYCNVFGRCCAGAAWYTHVLHYCPSIHDWNCFWSVSGVTERPHLPSACLSSPAAPSWPATKACCGKSATSHPLWYAYPPSCSAPALTGVVMARYRPPTSTRS